MPADVPQRPALVGRPLTRAAILFAGAAVVSACSSNSGTAPQPVADAADDLGHAEPLYGVVAMPPDAGEASDAEDDLGQGIALYGVHVSPDAEPPPPPDASTPPDATAHDAVAPTDAPPQDDAIGSPAYGVFIDAEPAVDAPQPDDGGQGMASYGVFVNPDGGTP